MNKKTFMNLAGYHIKSWRKPFYDKFNPDSKNVDRIKTLCTNGFCVQSGKKRHNISRLFKITA